MGIALAAGSSCNRAFINQIVRQVSVFSRCAGVEGIIRLNRPDLAVSDVHFDNTHVEAVFAASSVPDNIHRLPLVI
jgi:hypothetical protein